MKIVWGLLGTLCLTGAAHAVPVVIQVNGPDDKPVANAEVRAAHYDETDSFARIFQTRKPTYEAARSDDKGVARFDWPEPKGGGPGARGKYMGTATVWTPTLGAANLVLRPGDNSVKLGAMGSARGVVRDAVGAPVAGAKVRALGVFGMPGDRDFVGAGNFAVDEDEATFTATTDAQGSWQIGNLPIGARTHVLLEGDTYAAAIAFAPIVDNVAPTAAAVVDADIGKGISQNGELIASPAATLTGRVLTPAGAAVEGVTVWARPLENEQTYVAPKMASTDAQGEYKLDRLGAGNYKITLRAPDSSSLVADNGAAATVKVESGQTTSVPEQKLIEGGTITLQVSDAKTGQPILGVGALAQPVAGVGSESLITGNSDDKGKIQMHVAPGNYRVQLWQPPEGYMRPNTSGETVKVAVGATQTIALKLQSGVLAQGRFVDEKGKIVPNTMFALSAEKEEMWGGSSIQTDEKGEWKTQQFAAGTYKVSLNQSEKWELVGPKTLEIPTQKPVEIRVKPIAQTQIAGHVVDDAGKALAGVSLKAKITTQVDNYQTNIERQAVSDEKGNYTLPEFPTTAKTIVITTTRAGYAPQKAPEVKNENNIWSVGDAVLQALSSHLGGTVMNANNEAQKGVQVLAPRFGAVALSDEKGAWKFDAIAPGETEIVAVGAAGASAQTVTAGSDDVQLKLQPFVAAAPNDIDGANAVLDEAWQTSNGRKFYSRESLPATLAPYDADAALALARGGEAKASDAAVLQIVQVLARADVERAREWAPQVLATLEKPENQLNADLLMAKALVETHPDEAKTYLQAGSALYDGLKDNWQRRAAVSNIAVLKAKLKEADAQSWFERTLEMANDPADKYRDYSSVAWRMAEVSADWGAQIIEAAIKAAPEQEQYSSGPQGAAAAAIRRLATWNLDAAQKMLDKYSSLKGRYNSDYEMDRARATIIIERLKQNQDVEAALKSARELSSTKIRALSQIADLAPVEQRADILREALKLASANSYQKSQAIRLSWQILPYDRALATRTLDEIRPAFDNYSENQERYSRALEVSWWAFAYRTIDPVQSRWLLEKEWARTNKVGSSPDDNWQRANELQKLILAMAALDVPRAQAMIFALPIDEEGGAPFAAAQVLARWMLASDAERQTRPFEVWDDNDSEDGFYRNQW